MKRILYIKRDKAIHFLSPKFQISSPKFKGDLWRRSWFLELGIWGLGLLKNVQIYPVQSIIILWFFAAIPVFAEDNVTLTVKGNKAYTDKFYQQAINCYLKVVKNCYEAPELYYNIGNAYFKLNDYPSAILYFEKAKKLQPGDEDINYNLKVANTKIVDKIDAIPEFFIIRWYKDAANIFPFNIWAVLGLIIFVIFLGLLSVYLFSGVLKVRKIAFWCAVVTFLLTIKLFAFAQAQYSILNNTKEAVIFRPSVTAKSSPDDNSTDLFVIHEGTKIKIIDSVGEWSEIKIANGSMGWVNTSVFKII